MTPTPANDFGGAKLPGIKLPRYDRAALVKAFERELDITWDDMLEHPDTTAIAAALNALRQAEIK